MADVSKGLEIDPANRLFKELRQALKEEVRTYTATSKKVYGKMLEGGEDKDKEESKVVEIGEGDEDEQTERVERIERAEKVEDGGRRGEDGIEEADGVDGRKGEDGYEEILKRVSKLETVVEEIKFCMDILKGHGAIPSRMPTEEEKEEFQDRYGSDRSLKRKSKIEQESSTKWTIDD
mmetsp:Transcript_11324/g.12803  ORF Transcript_11324/g.12803 Transcript_11324/m.12803 type:complete len:178 (+) Transcript_11324:679-1212(+)